VAANLAVMPAAAPPRAKRPAATPRPGPSPAQGGRAGRLSSDGRIRWDRVGRIALLALLAVVLMLYVAPLRQWLAQSRAAEEQRRDLHALEREHDELSSRARQLRREPALEREARRYGMVRRGERAFVIQPTRPRGPG
jgi:cell division protein FtsB